MYILKDIFTWIFDKGNIFSFIIGFGLALFTLYQIFRPKLKKIEQACEDIDFLDKQTKGRISFAKTISDHELRIALLERDMSWIKPINDRRKFNMPVPIDRRKNGYNC